MERDDASADTTEFDQLADSEAFRHFYGKAVGRVYSYFLGRCGGRRDLAEELTQETFLAAITSIQRGHVVLEPMAWLIGIARYKLIDHYRLRGRQDDQMSVERTLAVSPSLPASTTVREVNVLSALDRVAPRQRTALILRYVDDLSTKEVADLLGLGVRAAESLVARGRSAFSVAYEEILDA